MFVMTGCVESEYIPSCTPSLHSRFLRIEQTALNFTSSASSQSINVSSELTPWAADIPASWVTSNPASGVESATVQFSVQKNNSADTSRVCLVNIVADVTDWNRTIPLMITQAKATPYINVLQAESILDGKAQTQTLTLESNVTYNVNSTVGWLNVVNCDMEKITFSAEENTTGNARSGQFTLAAPGITKSISVVQRAANISTTTSSLAFGVEASTQGISVESEATWSAVSSDWIQLTPSAGGAGHTTMSVGVPKNASIFDRYGFVYLTVDGTNRVEIPVVQSGVLFKVSTDNMIFDSFGGTQNFSINSNDSWEIISAPAWVELSTMYGRGDGTVSVAANENNTTTPLSGKIVISTTDRLITQEISVQQSPKQIAFDAPTISFPYAASTQSFSFKTDGRWTASTQSDWFTINTTSGTGDATITISASENMTDAPREGVISINIADQSFVVYVQQECKLLHLSSPAFTFEADKGSTILTISSNTQWTAEVTEGKEWIAVAPQNGSGNGSITISVDENNTVTDRKGKVLVTIPGIRTYLVEITQNRRYIKTDMSSVDFTSAGGQITFNVTTNGTYEVSRIGDWFGYRRNGNSITVIASENTTTESRSGAIVLKMTNLTGGQYSILIPITQTDIKK